MLSGAGEELLLPLPLKGGKQNSLETGKREKDAAVLATVTSDFMKLIKVYTWNS